MKKRGVLKLSALGVAAALAIGGGITLMRPTQNRTASAISVFKTSESVTMQADYQMDSAVQNDTRTGILLKAQQSGASIDFASAMSGAFEMDFRVFMQETPSASELEKTTFYPSSDLVSMSIVFTDATNADNTFSLVIDSSTAIGAIPTAHVQAEGKNVGIFRRARWTWKNYGVYNENNPYDKDGDGYVDGWY